MLNNTSVMKNVSNTHDLGNLKDTNATSATTETIVIVVSVLNSPLMLVSIAVESGFHTKKIRFLGIFKWKGIVFKLC